MGPIIFVALVAAIVVVIGFLIYGMFLGLASLGRHCKRLFWPELDAEEKAAVAAATQILAQARCWEIKDCSPAQKRTCPAYNRPGLPCWLANMQTNEDYRLKSECLACTLFSLPALLN